MFKSLLGALLPVTALAVRGTDDGSSRENAHDTWAINNDGDGVWFHLYHWTSTAPDGVTKLWNGDLTVNTRNSYKYIAYGWCMEILNTEEEDWDCMRALVTVDPTGDINRDQSQWRAIEDWKYTGTHANFRWNKLVEDELPWGDVNPTSDFRFDLDNSYSNCSPSGNNMNCPRGDELTSGLTTRFQRNWVTADAPTFDATISHETGGIERKFFAFVNQFKNEPPADNSVEPDFITKTWSTSNVKITPVMPIIQDAWEEQEKDQRLALFDPKTAYQMKVGDIVDEQLLTIPAGPGDAIWDYSIKAVSGKEYPLFVSINQDTQTLEFRPDLQVYDYNRFYFMLVVEQRGDSNWKKEKEIEVFVGDPLVIAQKQQKLDNFVNAL